MLLYMQQRYYDPRVGRFWSTDPVNALSGPFNRYWYANNNPYRFTDPDGRAGCEVCNDLLHKVRGAAINFAAKSAVAIGRTLVAEGKAIANEKVQEAKDFVRQRDVIVSVGGSGMFGAPLVGNGLTPGFTIVADASIVANLRSGQFGVQGSVGAVPSIGGGAAASTNISFGLNEGPLTSGVSTANAAFAQVLEYGGAAQWNNGGGNVSAGVKPSIGTYIGAGGGPVITWTKVSAPIKDDEESH